jgi:drug/metabolite transporter (DMT)-like permease
MFKKNLLILFVLLSLNIFADSIRVIVPDGLPALSIVNMVSTTKEIDGKKIDYKIEKLSDALVVNMLKREGDIAVVPSNFSAQLYNKNLGYKILGTVGWGSFYVVSRENIKSLEELKGKEVYTFGKGLTPDIIFQSILEKKGIDKKDILLLISIGIIGHTISIVTQEYGTMYSSAQMGSVVTSATPAFMLIFAVWLLKEKITLRKILSVILATVGVIMIAGVDNMDFDKQLGVLFSTIAALTWALMSVMLKLIPSKYPPLLINFYAVITGIVCLAPLNIPTLDLLPWDEILNPVAIGSVVYLGAVSTAGAFLLWNKGLLLMEAGASGLFFFFQPIVGTFLGWLILDEQITLNFWIGSILIFIGVFLVTVRNE